MKIKILGVFILAFFSQGSIYYLGSDNISAICNIILAICAIYGVLIVYPNLVINRRAELAGEILSLLEDYEDKITHLSNLRYHYNWLEWSRSLDVHHKDLFLPAKAKSYRLKESPIMDCFSSLQKIVAELHGQNRFENQMDEITKENFWKKEWRKARESYRENWEKFEETLTDLKEKLLQEALYESKA